MTFREKSITRLYAFAMAAVFALVLAGCGGGGGSASAPDPEPPTMPEPTQPTPQEMCEGDGGRYNADGSCTSAADLAEEMALSGAQEAAMAAYMAAMAAVSGAKDPVAMGKAQMYADMAKEASDMAAGATTSEMAMEYQMKAEMNRDMAMKAAGMRGLGLTNLANKITNQSAIDNAVLEGKPAVKPVSNAGRVGTELAATAVPTAAGATPTADEIAAVVTHTTVDDSGTPPTAPGGSVAQGGAVSATAAYGASGPTITVTGVGTGLLRGENPMLLTTRGGWMGRELVLDDDTSGSEAMSYANVYTDIQAPVRKQNYGDTTDGTDVATDPNDAVLAIGQIITGDIPGDGSTFTGTRNVSATDNIPTQTGRFFCAAPGTAPGCSISVDEDGKITSVTGYGWQPIDTGTSPTNDADYLAWGVWLTVPDATASAASAGAFASGNDAFTVRAQIKGTATYNGVASGLYSAGGMVEYFDADVSLMANFGGTDGADSTPGSAAADADNDGLLLGVVTGSVSNIKAGGMDVEGMLTLKRAPVLRTGNTATDVSTTGFEGAADGTVGGALLMGRWGGQFYGPNKASGKGIETEYPTTAAGTFGVTGGGHTPMSLLGSFGAWKAE